MSCTTIRWFIVESLRDLSKEGFALFCFTLRDRRGEPAVRRCAVEGKDCLQIADLLVSTFTEPEALRVTVDILRQINCNEEANALYSKTKVCMDKGDPTFRRTSTGELQTQPSQEALSKAAGRWPSQAAGQGGPPVLSEGGGPRNDDKLFLSRCIIQFGTKYKGQTFKWLLENDVSYAAFVVAGHQERREHPPTARESQSPPMASMDSLTRYVSAFPEVMREVRFHRAYERSLQSGQEGKALVGFGLYRWVMLQDLYKSKDQAKISYVDFLRTMKSTCDPGSKMETAVRYILKRDRAAAARKRLTRSQSTSRRIQRKPKGSWRM